VDVGTWIPKRQARCSCGIVTMLICACTLSRTHTVIHLSCKPSKPDISTHIFRLPCLRDTFHTTVLFMAQWLAEYSKRLWHKSLRPRHPGMLGRIHTLRVFVRPVPVMKHFGDIMVAWIKNLYACIHAPSLWKCTVKNIPNPIYISNKRVGSYDI